MFSIVSNVNHAAFGDPVKKQQHTTTTHNNFFRIFPTIFHFHTHNIRVNSFHQTQVMTDSTQSLINSTEVLIPVIKDLSELSLPGNIPNIQFVCQSIDIETRKDELYFSAKGEFESCFGQEMEQIHFLESMTVSGQRYVHMLYTFRSVSRAIPMISIVTPADASKEIQESYDIRREELNKKIIEILRPEILKLKELMVFVRDFVRIFCDFFRFLTSPEALVKIIPESVYEALIKSIDLIVKLDHLKDQKASVNNDFTRYKRSLMLQTQVAKRTTAPSGSSNSSANSDMLLDESTQLQLFLSNPDPRKAKHYIYLTLQEELKKINGYDHILVDIIEHSLEYMEKSLFVTPDDKHRTVRILPYLVMKFLSVPLPITHVQNAPNQFFLNS